jgi:hypothetical protein
MWIINSIVDYSVKRHEGAIGCPPDRYRALVFGRIAVGSKSTVLLYS